MPPFAECCVIIPCSTIEDFPSRLDPAGSRSLLGALTAAWHPRLIASTRRTPTWHRSDDTPPTNRYAAAASQASQASQASEASEASEASSASSVSSASSGKGDPSPVRLLIIPEVCVPTLPTELAESIERDAVSHHTGLELDEQGNPNREVRVRVSSRSDAIEKIAAAYAMIAETEQNAASQTAVSAAQSWSSPAQSGSPIDERDFFALGYVWWQTQVLTRRLRYTSNLDQIHFETRLAAAATAYLAGETAAAIDALHDCFDALAEERDHYFSSDPAIVDLTLLTPGTIDSWLDRQRPPGDTSITRATTTLATPENVLVDEAVARALLDGDAQRRERFCQELKRSGDSRGDNAGVGQNADSGAGVGLCGGGPDSEFSFDDHSVASAEQRIAAAIRTVQASCDVSLKVYARFGGGIAGEWVPPLAAAGFQGIVPIDFLGGRGFDEESKVILGEGTTEIEALTAKPIDAEDDSSFLTLSTRMGEAIDRGEIATALLVHWPGGGCDSYHDVRRAASWSLCLGRFWRIDDYFIDGERPFHHGTSPKASPAKCETLGETRRRREQLGADLLAQSEQNLRGFAALLNPSSFAIDSSDVPPVHPLTEQIASTLGFDVDENATRSGATPGNCVLLNPSHPATRSGITLAGKVSADGSGVFDAATSGGSTELIVDVPAWGFGLFGSAAQRQSKDNAGAGGSVSPLKKITRWLSKGSRQIAEGNRLSNEFMEVSIHPVHGGLEGVYSGAGRGNRFSTRILLGPSPRIDSEGKSDANVSPWRAVCKATRTLVDTRSSAVIEMTGDFEPAEESGEQNDANERGATLPSVRRWQSQYRLDRGSRRLLFRIRFEGIDEETLVLSDAWKRNPVLRIATAEASPIVRAILREKLVRTSARAFQSSLGYVIDEGERTTLIASNTASIHRCCGDRFFDTLLTRDPGTETDANWSDWQSFCFGFDVRHGVATAKAFAAGDAVCTVPVRAPEPSKRTLANPQRGWLMHPSPMSLDVQVVDVGRVIDEAPSEGASAEFFALQLRVIQTAGRKASATLRFCRDVHSAYEVSSLSRPFQAGSGHVPLTRSRLNEISRTDSLECGEDSVRWSHPSHGVVHVIVLFAIGGQT